MKISLSELEIGGIPVFSDEVVKYFQENDEEAELVSLAKQILADVEQDSNEKKEIIDIFIGNRAICKEDSLMRTQKAKLIYPICKRDDLYDV